MAGLSGYPLGRANDFRAGKNDFRGHRGSGLRSLWESGHRKIQAEWELQAVLLDPLPGQSLALPSESRLMRRSLSRTKDEARRLFLSGEMTTNAEIAARLKTKPHTIAKWRKEEGWDDLRQKIDRRAAELFVEKIATDRVTLNVRHYRFWELILAKMMEDLKGTPKMDVDDLVKVTGILDRAQKGQRLAKGLSVGGETEEQIRAQSQAELRRFIDTFIDAVKENVADEDARERIRQALNAAMPRDAETVEELVD